MTYRILLLLLALPVASVAQAHCFDDAAKRYGISESLLKAIAQVESSGNPNAMNMGHVKRTKSYDIGLMQINSSWLRKLSGFGITEEMLKEPCQNVMVGAWILSHHLKESGANWNGVGAYNASCRTLSKTECEKARNTYSWKVYRALLGNASSASNPARRYKKTSPAVVASSQRGAKIRSIVLYDPESNTPATHSELEDSEQGVLLASSFRNEWDDMEAEGGQVEHITNQ